MNDAKSIIYNFIKNHKICVISTVNEDNKPESAVIEFGETKDLEIIFDTFNYSRKFKNIINNPSVSIVIGWDQNISVQYEGIAKKLRGRELKEYRQTYFRKNPRAQKWEYIKENAMIKIKPKWIRFSDFNLKPWKVFEVTKFN